jgi:hypothetical protein
VLGDMLLPTGVLASCAAALRMHAVARERSSRTASVLCGGASVG